MSVILSATTVVVAIVVISLLSVVTSDKVEIIPAMGRPFHPGMLYDARREMLLEGLSLWPVATVTKFTQIHSSMAVDYKMTSAETIKDRMDLLGVSASLTCEAKLLKISGSAAFLYSENKVDNKLSAQLKYTSRTKLHQLNMEALGHVTFPRLLTDGTATHVVVGVLYGADAIFDFSLTDKTNFESINVTATVSLVVPVFSGFEATGSGNISFVRERKRRTSNLTCTFYGDFLLEDLNPTNFDAAMQVYSNLPKFLGAKQEKAVPMQVWLLPLSELNSKAQRPLMELSKALMNQAVDLLDELATTLAKCKTLRTYDSVSGIDILGDQLATFVGYIQAYQAKTQGKLAEIIQDVTGNGVGEKLLGTLFKEHQISPFADYRTTIWLRKFTVEAEVVNTYVKAFRRVSNIVVALDTSSYQRALNDLEFDVIISLTMEIFEAEKDNFLDEMNEWLAEKNNSSKLNQPKIDTARWYEDTNITGSMLATGRQFMRFAQANQWDLAISFAIVAARVATTGKRGSFIRSYVDGILTGFPPVGPPQKPTVTHSNVDNFVTVGWSKPLYGSGMAKNYYIQHRKFNTSDYTVLTYGECLRPSCQAEVPLDPGNYEISIFATHSLAGRSLNSTVVKINF